MDNKDTYGIITPNELNKLIAWRTRDWNHKNVSIINGDLLDRDVCLKSFRGRPEIVIHMATYPRAKIVDEDPILGIPKVIDTTTNLLWHASKFDTKKFVYISSSMVYGDFKDGTREDSSTKPQNIYGEAKLTGERLTKLFAKRDGLNYVIVRPSGVFGPGDLPDRVVSKFFDKAMRNSGNNILGAHAQSLRAVVMNHNERIVPLNCHQVGIGQKMVQFMMHYLIRTMVL